MAKYYVYSNTFESGKYTEVSEKEFKDTVIDFEGRYYISFGNAVLECSEQEYKDYASKKNRHKYLDKEAKKKKVVVISIEETTLKELSDETAEEEIIEKAMLEFNKAKLKKALSLLDDADRNLVTAYYFKGMTQEMIAKIIGKNQQTVSYQINKCLVKLAELMKKS